MATEPLSDHAFESLVKSLLLGEPTPASLYEDSQVVERSPEEWRALLLAAMQNRQLFNGPGDTHLQTGDVSMQFGPKRYASWYHEDEEQDAPKTRSIGEQYEYEVQEKITIPLGNATLLKELGVLYEDGNLSRRFLEAMIDLLQECGLLDAENIQHFSVETRGVTQDNDTTEPLMETLMTFEAEDIAARMEQHLGVRIAA